MRNAFFLFVFFLLVSFRFSVNGATVIHSLVANDTVYKIPVKTIDNATIDLNNFKGKKILIVVLPVSSTDTSLDIAELRALQEKHSESLVVIGVPALDVGYSNSLKQEMKTLYSNQTNKFILAEGMTVKNNSGDSQSLLFQWLTNKDKNRHFNQDIVNAGHKFFIDEAGELYAVFNSKIKLSHPAIDRAILRLRLADPMN